MIFGLDMWSVGLCVVALIIISITHWTYRWRNPRCNGRLPPGSMGLPLIGETLHFFIPNNSLDIPPFIDKRIQKYGTVFRTSLAGRPVIVSADPEFNHFIFLQEGKLVEFWYLDSFSKLFYIDGSSTARRDIHKYLRNLVLNHFGPEMLKDKLLPEIQNIVCQTLHSWSDEDTIEVKQATSVMVFDYTSKRLFGYDPAKHSENLAQVLADFIQGLMSFPLNIPGTAYHRCLKKQEKATKLMRDTIKERRDSPELRKSDFLDALMEGMSNEKVISEDLIVYVVFGVLFASYESISSAITMVVKLLTDYPLVLQELTEEHVDFLKKRENVDSPITWNEYKSMTFTMNVINETLRIGNLAPAILRRAIKDIPVNGYTIPAGWTIMVVPPAIQLNPNTFEDPLAFKPSRWKDLSSNVTSKNFMAFGGGMRQCAGAEFTKVFMAIFLHVLVTKYRWTKIKGGDVCRSPTVSFKNGLHINLVEKHE